MTTYITSEISPFIAFAGRKNGLLEQHAALFARIARKEDVVLAHHATNSRNAAFVAFLPCAFVPTNYVKIKHTVQTVCLLTADEMKRIACELDMVYIADDDVEVCILCVMIIVYLAAFDKYRILLGMDVFTGPRP